MYLNAIIIQRANEQLALAMSIISCAGAVYIMSVAEKIPIIQTTNNMLKGSQFDANKLILSPAAICV